MKNVNYNRGFYIVLTLCIVAIGVAGYVNFNEETEITAVVSNESTAQKVEVITPDVEVIEQVDIPVITEVEPVVSEPEIAKEVIETIETEEEVEQVVQNSQATVTIAPSVEITKTEEIFVRPCDGGVINGNSLDELVKNVSMNDWRTHNATDYSVLEGQNIFAIANGEVISIETNDQYGTIIEISHSDGLVTKTYGLNAETVAKIGDQVVAGDVIGTAIGTFPAEISEGNHIHVEATKNGENIDLETLFN